MDKLSLHVLRIGLGITFLLIGLMIFRQPEAWGGYMQPWAMKLLPVPIAQAMLGTAFLDMALGILLLLNVFVWFVALIGAFHLVIVLAVSGITDITVRDIGLLAATLALMMDSYKKKD